MNNLRIICIYSVFLFFSCDPPSDCTEPRCVNSPIFLKLKADLNDTNRLLYVGDTLKMRVKILDSLTTNQGGFSVASIQNAFFGIDYYQIDTIISKEKFTIHSESFTIKKGRFAAFSTNIEFDFAIKEAELHFICAKKGKYYIQIGSQSGRLEMTDKNGQKFLIMLNTGFNTTNSHTDLYLSWIGDPAYRNEMKSYIQNLASEGFGWYAFKVE